MPTLELNGVTYIFESFCTFVLSNKGERERGALVTTKVKLVARAKKGDKDAFQALVHEEKEKLYKVAFVYMKNEDEELEVFQETLYTCQYENQYEACHSQSSAREWGLYAKRT